MQSGLYVSGWLRRGPSGIIATNITDARDTVKSVVQDVKEGRLPPPVVSRDGWEQRRSRLASLSQLADCKDSPVDFLPFA